MREGWDGGDVMTSVWTYVEEEVDYECSISRYLPGIADTADC
jgi:hypothetical protein